MIGVTYYGILNNYSDVPDVPWFKLWHNNIVILHSLIVDNFDNFDDFFII